jgi:hypothetical protein
MGANLAMNHAAALSDRRHPTDQCLTDGTATLARANQSHQGDFPGSEPVFLGEKTYPAARRTRGPTIPGETLVGDCRFSLLRPKSFPNMPDNERSPKNEDHHTEFAPCPSRP